MANVRRSIHGGIEGSLAGSYFFSKHLDIIAQVSKLYSKYQGYIPSIKAIFQVSNLDAGSGISELCSPKIQPKLLGPLSKSTFLLTCIAFNGTA